MLKWGIEDAVLAATDSSRSENIIRRHIDLVVPKSYSYEYANIGVVVAKPLGCRGFTQRVGTATQVIVVGYESDVDRVEQLIRSLVLQCTLELGAWFLTACRYDWSGTRRYKAKKSFIVGFANGVMSKLEATRRSVVAESTSGTDVALIERITKVNCWITTHMYTTQNRGRRYGSTGWSSGQSAGLHSDVGDGRIGTDRRALER